MLIQLIEDMPRKKMKGVHEMENEKLLNDLLGEDLSKQVQEKFGDKKIFIGEGEFIPKSRFDDVNNRNKELQTQLTDVQGQLAKSGESAKTIEELQASNKALQDQIKKNAEDYEVKTKALEKDYLINDSIKDAKAKNVKAVRGLLDLEKITVENGKITGLDEQIKALQQSDAYLFGNVETPPASKGGLPPVTPPNTQQKTQTDSNYKPWNAHKRNHF